MRNFHSLENWNKDRDASRRHLGDDILRKNNIPFSVPSKGHFKIESKSCHTVMFYPKSGTIVWKEHRGDRQHKFVNDDEGKIIQKLKTLI